jgi:hypothetical protein
MAHPWTAHGEDCLQVWRLQVYSVNSFGRQMRGVPSPCDLGLNLSTPHREVILSRDLGESFVLGPSGGTL